MAVTTSYPGVYIEEFAPAPPIQGLSTSVAAFLGPSPSGPILEPQLVTSWDQFKQIFGRDPLSGYYLWFAVRGFFENSGQLAYIVRISNASAATWLLPDRAAVAPPTALVALAKALGAAGNSVQIKVDETQALNHVVAFRHDVTILSVSGTTITFSFANDAVLFRPGDVVIVDSDTANRAQVLSVDSSHASVTLTAALPAAAAGQNLRLDDLRTAKNDRILRVTVPSPDNPVDLTAGTVLWIDNATNHEPALVESVAMELITQPAPPLPAVTTYRVTLRKPVAHDYGLAAGDHTVDITSREFDLTASVGTTTETYPHVSIDPVHPHYYVQYVNNHSQLIELQPPPTPDSNGPPDYLPAATAGLIGPTTNGADELLSSLLPSDYETGLDHLVNLDVNIVAIPDRQDVAVQTALIDHCQGVSPKFGNRFAILDSQPGVGISGPGSVASQIAPLAGNGYGFGALYYPWVIVPPAPPSAGGPPPVVTPPNVTVPPSGHVAGVYARTDNSRGVHKAPAGIEAGLFGTLGVEKLLGDIEQGLLNMPPYGINVIRSFRGGLPTIWGARTNAVAAGNANWQYVNVRRLFLFLEASITAGIRFAVFEPNTPELWGKLKRSIGAFLNKVWRDGALFGRTAKDAYYVRIDEVLNPPEQRKLGYLTIEIGVCPAYPAEFIVVRIGIWDGGSSITEV